MPVHLGYEPSPAAGRPPAWVIAVAVSYGLLLLAFLAIPAWFRFDSPNDNLWVVVTAAVTALMVSWVSLLWIPVRVVRRRPVTRRSLLIPIIGSGLLASVLLFGLLLAVVEWASEFPGEITLWTVIGIAVAGWIVWAILFWRATRNSSRGFESHSALLSRRVLAGSALELLVAIPAHIVVRRRTECCAGMATGTGICCGLAVALVAMGPGVFLLYRRRVRDITRPTRVAAV